MRTDSLAFRFAVITGIWALLALAVGGPALSVVFQRSLVKIFDARLEDEIDNMTAALFRAEHIGSVENLPFTRVRSEFYWQVMLPGEDGPEILLKSNSLLGPRFSLPIEKVPGEGERIYANDTLVDAQEEERRPVRVLYASVLLPGNPEPYIIAVGVERGKVLAFDVQAAAIESARRLVSAIRARASSRAGGSSRPPCRPSSVARSAPASSSSR